MDITNAQTEPFFLFHRFHEASNRTIKSIAASIQFTKRAAGDGDVAKRFFSVLIEATSEPWGQLNHYDAGEELDLAYRFLPEMAVVRVDSAFDYFLTSIEAEISRWAAFLGTVPPAATPCPDESETIDQLRAARLCDRMGWSWRAIEAPLRVYHFFHLLRNCIAHRDGRLSSKALNCFNSREFTDAWRVIGTRRISSEMSIPEVVGDKLFLRPRDAIFFSGVCHEIASLISTRLRSHLGARGILHMAAYHTLLSEVPISWGSAHRTPEAVLNVALMNRMRVREVTSTGTIMALKRLNLWKRCLARHGELEKQRYPEAISTAT